MWSKPNRNYKNKLTLIDKRGLSCEVCFCPLNVRVHEVWEWSWDYILPEGLELKQTRTAHLHHADNNPDNDCCLNLYLLCPTCHSRAHRKRGFVLAREAPQQAINNMSYPKIEEV